jgi:hypothetical protein
VGAPMPTPNSTVSDEADQPRIKKNRQRKKGKRAA